MKPSTRFLIQLVDATDEADAYRILREMFGPRTANVATLKRGTNRMTARANIGNPSPSGFTVYVPSYWRV